DPAGAGEREGGGGGGDRHGSGGAVGVDGAHGEPGAGGGCAGAVPGGASGGGGADPRGAVGGGGGVGAERQGERGDRVPAGRARCAGGDAAVRGGAGARGAGGSRAGGADRASRGAGGPAVDRATGWVLPTNGDRARTEWGGRAGADRGGDVRDGEHL